MNRSQRVAVITLFALVGAFLSVALMPRALDSIFLFIHDRFNEQNVSSELPEGGGPLVNGEVDSEANLPDGFIGPVAQTKPPLKIVPGNDVGVEPPEGWSNSDNPAVLFALAILGLIVGGSLGTITCRSLEFGFERWERAPLGDKVTLFVGVFFGIVASIPFLFVLQGLGPASSSIATVALMLGLSSVSVLALRSMREVLPWYSSSGPARRSGIKLLDTSVVIDGRIMDIARAGFVEGEIYIPGFVIAELQQVADSHDDLKRQRGRRGLEVLRLLQAEFDVTVGTKDKLVDSTEEEVDARLVLLAKRLAADLVTNDFNLNRVAKLHQVPVLNVNDLALALRPVVLPGEEFNVAMVKPGTQHDQGVAYLEDGTMVVVEGGRSFIGESVGVLVTQVIQTERGKMIFAKMADE